MSEAVAKFSTKQRIKKAGNKRFITGSAKFQSDENRTIFLSYV
jgi:hypothetical protein